MGLEHQKKTVLEQCLGQSKPLNDLIQYSSGSIVSKTILDKSSGTITLFAFDQGQRLSEHTAPYEAIVHVIDGIAQLTIGGKDVDVTAGEIIIMPANISHAVTAKQKFKMLLTMIRA